jgi:hypothetical protein
VQKRRTWLLLGAKHTRDRARKTPLLICPETAQLAPRSPETRGKQAPRARIRPSVSVRVSVGRAPALDEARELCWAPSSFSHSTRKQRRRSGWRAVSSYLGVTSATTERCRSPVRPVAATWAGRPRRCYRFASDCGRNRLRPYHACTWSFAIATWPVRKRSLLAQRDSGSSVAHSRGFVYSGVASSTSIPNGSRT